ncbi:carbohydrate ABC transporter permease [Aestuariimicrobium ganziense]|uniref:carbohydrate ABC transporter permease n=1 Tax=Aestuariimicrobium ganziense TaxID=2773677 RepID=UPI001943157B|nr:carbohydrate ABC transporter permease [Aestuariimicrobium ganziense]
MNRRPRRRARVLAQVVATLVAAVYLFPLVSAVLVSGEGGEGYAKNYWVVLTESPLLRFARNSLVIVIGTVSITYVATMLAAYAFAKVRPVGNKTLYYMVLAALTLPAISLIVPLFAMVQRFNLFNNYFAVILPLAATSVPFTVLLTRNFMEGVPNELLEAAEIEGASSFRALLHIVLPLAKPISAVVIVWTLLGSWNEFFLPLLFFQDPSMQVVTQVPTYFTGVYSQDTPKVFAALILISMPVVITYLSMQRYFERGLTAGALK